MNGVAFRIETHNSTLRLLAGIRGLPLDETTGILLASGGKDFVPVRAASFSIFATDPDRGSRLDEHPLHACPASAVPAIASQDSVEVLTVSIPPS